MKSKFKLTLIFLLMVILSAALGYLVRRLYVGHKAESAFQSLAEQMSDSVTETEEENNEATEPQQTEEIPESRPSFDEPVSLPVIRKKIRTHRLLAEEVHDATASVAEENSPSAVGTEPAVQASTSTAARLTEQASVPAASSSSRFYNDIPNCIGWLQIKGTAINYPVMQTKDDPEYYLHRAVSGDYSFAGVPFLDARCSIGESNQLVIYGHNMKNGTMFHNLRYYASKEFWKGHRTISLETLDGRADYEVMAVIQYDADHDPFRFYTYARMDLSTFVWFLRQVHARQIYDTGVTASFGDELMTLCTCDWTHANGRLLVIARRCIP